MNGKREKLEFGMSTQDIAIAMAEANPGALSVICNLLQEDPMTGLSTILHLDDMNIRGSGIWIAFKDVCGEDLEELTRRVQERDMEIVNAVSGAVRGGASGG